jgi:hypothetical protein
VLPFHDRRGRRPPGWGVGDRRILLRGTGAPLLDDPEARKAYLGL